jgi:hypothetical protein
MRKHCLPLLAPNDSTHLLKKKVIRVLPDSGSGFPFPTRHVPLAGVALPRVIIQEFGYG